jgi:hypothetical protein
MLGIVTVKFQKSPAVHAGAEDAVDVAEFAN